MLLVAIHLKSINAFVKKPVNQTLYFAKYQMYKDLFY